MLNRLSLLKDRHRGRRCVLVANGPSLNAMELGFLRRETVIAMNKIFLGFRKFAFYPRYYVAVNRKVIEQSASEIAAMNCVKFLGDAGADGVVPQSALTYWVNTKQPRSRFCRDIALEGMHEGWTVTYAALQVAYFLGFAEVVIIGMDHRYKYDGAPNQEKLMEGADPNHFAADYFGYGQRWDNPDLAHSEESYRIARRYYEEGGRRIIDATVDGACEVFEKSDYRSLFLAG